MKRIRVKRSQITASAVIIAVLVAFTVLMVILAATGAIQPSK